MEKYKQPPKSQFWSSIIYPNNFVTIEYLNSVIIRMHLPCVLSPLHNRDSKDGFPKYSGLKNEIIEDEWKKPHYHIMFMFPSAVSLVSYKYIIDKFQSYEVTLVRHELIKSGSSMARYFCHIDNPEKHRYSQDDMLYYGGLDDSILDIPKYNKFQENALRNYVIKCIIKNKICDLVDLDLYFDSIGDESTLFYVQSHSSIFEKYVRAMYWKCNSRVLPTSKAHARIQ